MGIIDKFNERIKKKEDEIQELETKIREAKAYLQALQDTIRLLPRERGVSNSVESTLKPGSAISKVLALLKNSGRPMHITEILEGIGKPVNKKNRASLSSALGWYVRKEEMFTRSSPNTFALISMEGHLNEEPPDDFGLPSDKDVEEHKEEQEKG